MMRYLKILIILFFIGRIAHAQTVIINEVSTNNLTTLPDNDGDFPDWVELYNTTASPISLANYKLSDDPAVLGKWVFPSVSIPANGYLTVYASDKNRVDFVDHWESLVLENNSWKYTVPSANIPGWTATGFADGAWSTGNGGIGYGDGDDNTVVANPTTSVYARRTFSIVDATAIQTMILYMDYDDGFVAYLNGVEISRANLVSSPVDYNTFADTDREAVMYTGGSPTAFAIAKTTFQPLLVTGTNVLSIEIHNKSATSSDMSMRPFLLAGISNATVSYQALPGWFTPPAMSNNIHTNFKLSASGETVYLSNASGTVINTLAAPAMLPDDTYGRFPNGSTTNRVLQPATPNATNGTSTAYTGYWNDVLTMSPAAGYYSGTQSVTLSALNAGTTIRYTTDGTKPTLASPVYSGAISVTATKVIRAAAFNTAGTFAVSKYETNSYFINDNTTIPVISISTAPANFFSNTTGIYVDGPNAGTCPAPYQCYNYWQDWEREVHIEYFDKTKAFQFEQDAGVKVLGGWSRTNAMKSLQVRAGDEYGKGNVTYPLFTETKKSGLKSFDSFTLRNGGNDFNYTMLRDAVNQRVLNSMQPCVDNFLDFEGYEPVLVYINGVYWGVHTLRERVDNSFFDNNAGYGKGEYDLGETSSDGRLVQKKGSLTGFNNLLTFVSSNTMNTANYTTVKSMLDIENFVDYFSAEFFHTNWDWPHNNVKFWRPQTASGKWRYIYHDTDFGYGIFGGVYATASTNEFNRIMVSELSRSEHAPLFTKLITNTEFKNYYVNRSADLLNTIYNTPYLKGFYDVLENQLSPEMARHFTKWPQNAGSVAGWNSERTYVKNFMDSRVSNIRSQITSTFSAGAQVSVTLNTSPAGAGKIKISTITPCSLPWTGVYFNGVPVTMEVIPNDGYVFNHWLSSGSVIPAPNTNKIITLNIGSTDNITAYFNTTTNIPKLTITEVNYHSDTTGGGTANAGDWIELYNPGNATLDLSGWVFKDGSPFHKFVFPAGTTIGAGQYLVVVSDVVKFQAVNPSVTNFIGPVVFDFSNGGETLSLVDQGNAVRASVTYSDATPWPTLADGLGTTLERVMTATDLNDPATWFDGCRKGSPGKAYTPCPCMDVELGPNAILCTSGGSKTLNTGLVAPHTNRKFYWYKDGVALAVPVTNATLTVGATGVYKVLVDSMGCYKTDIVSVVADLTFDLGPAVSLCSPVIASLDSRLPATGVTYVWTKNTVVIPSATGPALSVTAAGTYALTATATGCAAKTDNVVVTSVAATPTDASRCMPGSVTLGITGPGTYQWYATPVSTGSLGSGASFVTPSLTNTTTYYVQDMSFYGGTVGPVDTTFGNLSPWVDNNMSAYRLRFDVTKACTLNYITVFADGPQTIVITLYASNGTTVLNTRSVAITAGGAQRIPVGFSLAVGTGYYIGAGGSTGNLYYNHDNPSYPYTEAGGYIKINDTDPTWVRTNGWYPYLYKWEFSNGPGPCDRVPVTAYNTCPVPVSLLSFQAERRETGTVLVHWKTASELNSFRFVVERSSDGIHFDSIGFVGATGNSTGIVSYSFEDKTATSFGCYYRLKQIDQDYSAEYSTIVKIANEEEGGLFVSPNPSLDKFDLIATSASHERITITVSDLSGKIILKTDKYFTNQVVSFGEELAQGSYLLQVGNGERLNTVRIVKF